jgi:predicted molibdopterin-dependent oxidoreductase YjgC
MVKIIIDGASYDAKTGECLIDVMNRTGREIPQVCYHPQLGPIQTCDTCLVEIDGQLARACGTTSLPGCKLSGQSPLPKTNYRFGHPTPQRGVEVERKWKRTDYWMPGTQRPPVNTDNVNLPSGENHGSVDSF